MGEIKNISDIDFEFTEKINAIFHFLNGHNVVLYGTGTIAASILKCKDLKFRISGVLDGKLTGGYFIDKPIYNMENLSESEADSIIITALGVNRPIIYERIKNIKKLGYKIYYSDGTEPSDDKCTVKKYIENLDKLLLPAIKQADVVSFDCFDTLIMRLILSPLPQHLNSIENEMNVCERRGDIWKYKVHAEQLGKIIVLTSDIYFSLSEMKTLALKLELGSFDKYFISSELNATKEKGDIWTYLKETYPNKRIIHIDDTKFDYPNYINGIQIKSSTEIAQLFNLPLNAGGLTGILLSGILKNPEILITKPLDLNFARIFGFCFIAPFAICFVQWLAEKFLQNNEKKVLFCSRDGYLAKILYDYFYKGKNGYPESGYLYVSKSVLIKSCSTDSEYLKSSFENYYHRFSAETKVKEAIFTLYGYNLPDCDIADKTVKSLSIEEIYKVLLKYENEIIIHCLKEKQNFVNYICNSGYNAKTDALVDFACGYTSLLLQKFFDGNLYVASQYFFPKFAKLDLTKIHNFLFDINFLEINSSSIYKYIHFFESAFSAPEKSVVKFSENGSPIFHDEEIVSNSFIKDEIFNGIIEFYKQTNKIEINYDIEKIDTMALAIIESFSDMFYEITNVLKWSSYTSNK
jgi:hypothetical protein